jgi:hypothetical protein
MLTKEIRFFGRSCTLVCDGRCDKAWGMNTRPKLFYMPDGLRALDPGEEAEDLDDYVYEGDDRLGAAPVDPGTYEGGEGKPSGVPLDDSSRMNKWCARECERSRIRGPGDVLRLPDLLRPRPNDVRRDVP